MTAEAVLPIIIDTDPGLGKPGSDIDDGFAIAMALRSPELDVRGLTIVNGNVDAPTGTDVAQRLLERLGRRDIPVLQGALAPLKRDMAPVRQLFDKVLRDDQPPKGVANLLPPTLQMHAADFLAAEAAAHPGALVVVAIGPMTNLALAIQRHPDFARNVRELVLMAGAATTYAQNITVVGDFNAYVDPEALDIVIRSGAPIRMVGLDQTSRVILTRADAEAMRAVAARQDDPFCAWAADCSDAWIDFLGRAFPNRPEHRDGCFLHDPLVLAAVIAPHLLSWAAAHVEVELQSELARGLVVADRGLALAQPAPANATVATDTDVAGFRRLFLERIAARPS
jgi:inosine-uridine nucleoside N-ribohydrolase